MDSFKLKKCNKYNSLFKTFVITFFVIVAIVVAALVIYYKKTSNDYMQYLKITETQTLKLEKSIILQKFNKLHVDLLAIITQKTLHNFLKNKTPASKKLVVKEFIKFCRLKGLYDQIRFVDKNGMETIKINNNDGIPKNIPNDNLISQKNKWFFRNTYNLSQGQMYISPLELLTKNGKIAQPLKPIILFGSPIFDSNGTKQGCITINYLATDIISTIRNFAKLSLGKLMLINSNGYWLFGAKKTDHNWGFMYNNRLERNFSKKYPTAWEKISKNDSVQIITNKGMFTSITIPLSQFFKRTNSSLNSEISVLAQNKILSDSEDHSWKLVTFVPKKDFISNANESLLQYLFWLGRILLILSTIPAFLVSYAITKIKYRQQELYLMANFDKLTKLPNRKHFFETLQQTVRQAIKSKNVFALLYLDIDNFKNINDTLGHEQGDNLLQEAATRFIHSVRNADLVARIGGDEFVIILYNIQSIANAKAVANKILDRFSKPFILDNEKLQIGVSIGISIFSKKSNNDSILLKQADKAMYNAKHCGKNIFKVFTEKTNC